MSDTPEPQNPPTADETETSQGDPITQGDPIMPPAEPTSEAPDGLEPSPGLAPPPGIQPPQVDAPQYHQAPQYQQPPQYQPPQFGPPQYQQQQHVPQQQPNQVAQDQPFQPGQTYQAGQPFQSSQPGQPGSFDPATPGFSGPPAPPKKGLSAGAIIAIVAGGVLLLALIIAGVFAIGSLVNRGSAGGAGAGEESTSSAGSAPEAVEEYLTAIADGDAETARAFVDGTSEDTLLTDEVLAKSLELAPITNIEVDVDATSDSDSESVVSASFDIGSETVTRDFRVWNYSDDWQIFDGLVNISLSSFDGLDATVNGAVPGDDYSRAFIGTYQVELGVEEFALSGDTDTFTLATDEDSTAFYEVQPVLTEEATATFRDLVRASLTECVALTSLATPCGLDVTGPLSDGAVPVDGTIQRTLTAEGDAALTKMKPEVSYDSPTVVSSYDYIQISTTLEADLDGQRVSGDLLFGGDLLKPYVDFAKDKLEVTWE